MKKSLRALVCLVLFLTLLPLSAMARSGTCYPGLHYDDLELTVTRKSSSAGDSLFLWSCSGKLSFDVVNSVFGLIGLRSYVDNVRLEVYETASGYATSHYDTLFIEDCGKKNSVRFSRSGEVLLPKGNYEFRLLADYMLTGTVNTGTLDTVAVSAGISGGSGGSGGSNSGGQTAPQQQTGIVTVICETLEGVQLMADSSPYPAGQQRIYAPDPGSRYQLIGDASLTVTVPVHDEVVVRFCYREKTDAPSGGSAAQVVCVTHSRAVNVRTGPGTGYEYICEVFPGQTFPYLGSENGWNRILYDGVHSGYVSGNLTSVQSASAHSGTKMVLISNDKAVNVRTGPGTGYTYICEVFPGQLLPWLGTEGGWHRVIYDGVNVGYVSGYITTLVDVP